MNNIMSPLNEALKAAGLPLREEFDPAKTSAEARALAKALKDQFSVPVDLKNNKDGSITITVNNGHLAPESEGSNPHVFTPKNLSKVIEEPYRAYRQKGWAFSQPVKGTFTIGVKE